MPRKLNPIHPGEVLYEEFLKPLKLSQYRVAKDISVSPLRISEVMRGKRNITVDTALRLGRYFGVSPQFWLNLQSRYDLDIASSSSVSVLKKEVKILQHA